MKDDECVELLKWMLPMLELRWAGFRRPHKQVCKRLGRRLAELGFEHAEDYRQYLTVHPEEWNAADSLCTVTISRFYRDRGVFEYLGSTVLPQLGARALEAGRPRLLAWSAGCSSGEEPYTLALVWEFQVRDRLRGIELKILGTDVDDDLLRRAHEACYPPGCLKDLPEDWRTAAFEKTATGYRLKGNYRARVEFRKHDIRDEPPTGPFDIVLCRNLAFTYFDHGLQLATAQRLRDALIEGGALVLGRHEVLPPEVTEFSAWSTGHKVYASSLTIRAA
ncbi:MAG TPA: CheR family methyltransferase [Gammaproteobacteria bacterium]|jgi:chemotaxis protein methyltransferase CheR|nr:CheR family methyltransferase [Gammaproteobacteria bacterium]